ncbi:DNA-binding domain-containing protein [Vibrio sp. SCSIO 43136]|uniref:HvfC/BufC N-terminal domain-containing protein n=1 Tax=Vibrio sp. SCSIO 43136 TaxID=2819101 RepID=UPI002075187D|nr:DNA-binding domain-containing protein [Vibrio sp. SCSIO 43136]USD65252.1 putative DNA-binding domain-containing protein [Vibrio sp. SCSIO 43136]
MNSPTLSELQKNFASALHYQGDASACAINGGTFSDEERMQIYRNNFIIGLSEVLQAGYPKVHALVGQECFGQLARQHVLDNPLTQADVSRYGEGFDQTIAKFDQVVAQVPYLQEIAQLEWFIDQGVQHLGIQSLPHYQPLERLGQLTPEQQMLTHLVPMPWLSPARFDFAVLSLWHAIENDDFEGLRIEQPQKGVIGCDLTGHPVVVELDEMQLSLFDACQQGTQLQNLEQQQLAAIQELASTGLIIGFRSNAL